MKLKRLFFPIVLAAALSGCAVVPYDQPYAVYSAAPAHTHQYFATPGYIAPGYVAPAPIYGSPIYVGPPVQFSFGLSYRSAGRSFHGKRHGFRQHRHGFRHGDGHRFRGGRSGSRR